MQPISVEINEDLKTKLSNLLANLNLNTRTKTDKVEASNAEITTGALFDELGNFKLPNKKPKCVGKCFLQVGEITPHNINQLKVIIKHVLPVAYHERFYNEVLHAGQNAKLAYFNDAVVGAVCCRNEFKEGRKLLYIMMIGTLAPYRRYGVGTMLMSHVLSLCEKDQEIESVFLHVQSNNEEAMAFYKKFGFEVVDRVEKYYRHITPDDAFLLEKPVNNGKKSVTVANTEHCGDHMI